MISRIYFMLCMFLPCGTYQIAIISKYKNKKYLIFHLVWVYIFLLYLFLVFEVTGIGTLWDIGFYGDFIRSDEINLVLLQDKNIIPYILNIIMFMPLGFLLPCIWHDFKNFKKVFLTGLGFSMAIEFCQLFNLRCSDIDDIFMNTLGTLLGYFLWKILDILFKNNSKKYSLSKMEPVIYLILSLLGIFILYNSRLFF